MTAQTSGRRGTTVTVVMPAWNTASFIEASVRSVHAQTWPDIELVVVDDGSTDGTSAHLAALADEWEGNGRRMTVIRQANAGAGAARNRGLEAATGRYIALQDSDDTYAPDLVSRQVAALEADDNLDLVFALYRYVAADGTILTEQPPPATSRPGPADLLADNIVHAPLFRAEILVETGGLDPHLSAHIDLDFFLRVLARREGSIGIIPEVLSDYTRHDQQITGDWRRMSANWQVVRDRAEARGIRFTPAQDRRMRSRVALYWCTLAYQAGRYADARRLVLQSLAADPYSVAADPHGRIRVAACAATMLPEGLHLWLRDRFNGGRAA